MNIWQMSSYKFQNTINKEYNVNIIDEETIFLYLIFTFNPTVPLNYPLLNHPSQGHMKKIQQQRELLRL